MRQFGGAGIMLESPELALRVTPAARFTTTGAFESRVVAIARRVAMFAGLEELPACELEVVQSPRLHVGLGVGTQLGLATTTALLRFLKLPAVELSETAQLAGRGNRSSVGAWGFHHGGLVVEAGKWPGEIVAPLIHHSPLPETWRAVLFVPTVGEGASGPSEKQAFASLPPVPEQVRADLCESLMLRLIPAVAAADFEEFATAVERYGRRAGECFAAVQEGQAFCNAETVELVEQLGARGAKGIGQSSWGGTVFCWFPSVEEAQAFADCVQRERVAPRHQVVVVRTSRSGHQVSVRN